MKRIHAGPGIAFAAVLVGLLGALSPATSMADAATSRAAAASEARGSCHTAAQSIVNRKNISCRKARHVANDFQKRLIPAPECKGDHSKRWNGWKLTAKPTFHGKIQGIGTKFTKGGKSFVLTGGGTC